MKKITLIALLVSASTVAFAAPAVADKDAVIARIAKAQLGYTMLTPDSPLVAFMLTPIRQANPNLSQDEWREIAKEVSSAVTDAMAARGGMVDTVFREALAPLSDAELKQLEVLLTDPVYQKFSTAMTAPAVQQKMMEAMPANALLMQAAVNQVLANHGLKELH